ncbi:cytochrome P450 [Kibdelosporangium persicum]|uniref:Pentalenic acid synthase n=1 Tax=Kibdelosporangium persicum TaxID=2698649 RepID=A0ABX2FJQ8_9PSEU|nr:cytochrome P450 [Kibdelosporangium persicum]NRN71026.1 Pentalenic acid synthase [Kibdelosporangium persicum]
MTREMAAQPLPLARECPLTPPAEYARLRAENPVSPLALPGGGTGWLVTRFEDVAAALVDPAVSAQRKFQTTVSAVTLTAEEWQASGFGTSFIGMDPPEHTRYRRMLTGQFTVRRLKELTPRIEQIVDKHVDAMIAAGPPADLVRDFAEPVPSLVICELLGMPYADSKQFQRHADAMQRFERTKEELLTAMTGMATYMRALVQEKRDHPDDGLISGLIRATPEDGVPLTDDELVATGNLLMIAGYATTANMIGMGALALLTHREQWEVLRDHPETIERGVEEMLRYLSVGPFGLPRTAKADTEIGGQRIRAGDPIVLSIESANRDPAQFESPDVLDVTRQPKRHLGFAYGAHQCLGQQLARLEMRIAFGTLTRRLPQLRLTVPAEQIPMRSDMQIYGPYELPVTW